MKSHALRSFCAFSSFYYVMILFCYELIDWLLRTMKEMYENRIFCYFFNEYNFEVKALLLFLLNAVLKQKLCVIFTEHNFDAEFLHDFFLNAFLKQKFCITCMIKIIT